MEVGQGPNWGCSAKEKKRIWFEGVNLVNLDRKKDVWKGLCVYGDEFLVPEKVENFLTG
jgi:hypothetical protein